MSDFEFIEVASWEQIPGVTYRFWYPPDNEAAKRYIWKVRPAIKPLRCYVWKAKADSWYYAFWYTEDQGRGISGVRILNQGEL